MLLMRLTRRIFRNQVVDVEKARAVEEKATRTSTRLVIFWSLLFLYGVVEAVRGEFPLKRAIPAAALLVLFIGIFGWGLYRAKRGKSLSGK